MAEQLFKVGDAAASLAVSVRTVWRLISMGELEAITVGGRSRRIPASSVAAFIERQRKQRGR
jgi:excisionase family DNA binding protein